MAKKTVAARSGRAARSTARKSSLDAQVGERIRQRRSELNLTQTEVARRLGISRVQLHKYETGESRLSFDRLYGLADLFAVPVTWFFDVAGFAELTTSVDRLPKHAPLTDDEILDGIETAVRGMKSSLLKLQVLEMARALAEADRTRSGGT